MPAKIRLQRRGKKGAAFYHIVIADGRAPRDGKFIEKLGTYNPLTVPATIDLNLDKAVHWLQAGATPTDTVKAILSHKGAMLKHHLLGGVAKGALTTEQAEAKFQAWLTEKNNKISSQANKVREDAKSAKKNALAEEAKINEARSKAIAEAQAKAAAKAAAAEAAEAAEVVEEVAEVITDVVAEVEAPVAEVEAPVAEAEAPATEEKPAE